MKFHNVHGIAINLSRGKSIATRSDSYFCQGIVFSDQPIQVNHKLCLELTLSQSWSGALRVGVTTHNPEKLAQNDLPRYAVPNLAKKEGYWIRPINEAFVNQGSKVTIYLSSQGALQLFVDGEHKGACLTGLPVDKALWVCLDLYGNTKSAKFVKPGMYMYMYYPLFHQEVFLSPHNKVVGEYCFLPVRPSFRSPKKV